MLTLDIEEIKLNLLNKYKACALKYGIPEAKYQKRYIHSIGVFEMAMELNNLYHLEVDEDHIALAALYHDYAKFSGIDEYQAIVQKFNLDPAILNRPKAILHAVLGCYMVMDELNVYEEDVFHAIETHSTGDGSMTHLQELIFISDLVEVNRKEEYFNKMRRLAKHNFKKAIATALRNKIIYIHNNSYDLDPITKDAYEAYKSFCPKGFTKIAQVLDCLDKNLTKDLVVYDARNYSPFFDFIIVASTSSNRQMQACINYLRDDFDIKGAEIGEEWTLIDLSDIVIHIFKEEDRAKFGLDRLYAHLPIYNEEKNE